MKKTSKGSQDDGSFAASVALFSATVALLVTQCNVFSSKKNVDEFSESIHHPREIRQEYDEENIRVYPLRSLVPERFVGREAYSPSTGAEEKKFWDSRFRNNGGRP